MIPCYCFKKINTLLFILGMWHWSGIPASSNRKYTKYKLALKIAKIIGLPHVHIIPEKYAAVTQVVPLDNQLNCIAMETMGFDKRTPIGEGLRAILRP
jgi:hypothetical protein